MKTDQTRQMPMLIRVFAGRTYHFVGFVMRRLIWFCSVNSNCSLGGLPGYLGIDQLEMLVLFHDIFILMFVCLFKFKIV